MRDLFDPFDELFGRWFGPAVPAARFLAADVFRSDDRMTIQVDTPGVDPDTIDVRVDGRVLSVSVERRHTPVEGDAKLVGERPHGRFQRRFYLDDDLDLDKVQAGYDHGVLTITIPVAEAVKPRKIAVGVLSRELESAS